MGAAVTGFWIAAAALLLAAIGVLVTPLLLHARRAGVAPNWYTIVAGGIMVPAIALPLYFQLGTWEAQPEPPSMEELAAGLEARLQAEPQNVEGWRLLGRSYVQLERIPDAARAYESVLKLEADDPEALWYAGLAALSEERWDDTLRHWQALLAQSPPASVRDILEKQIARVSAAARGEPLPPMDAPPEPASAAVAELKLILEVDESLVERVQNAAPLFVVASDATGPGPPVAVARRVAGDLPLAITLSDRDAMIPSRRLSDFPRLRLTARVALSGEALAQPGDLYGDFQLDLSDGDWPTAAIPIRIDRIVE